MSKKKLAIVVSIGLTIAISGFAVYQVYFVNPKIVRELIENPEGKTAARVMLIDFPSGKRLPVNYLEKDDAFWAGADGPWWREFREPGLNISIFVKGASVNTHGVAIENDEQLTKKIFAELRPTAPDWVGAVLVKFSKLPD